MKRRRPEIKLEKKKKKSIVAQVIPRLSRYSYKNTNTPNLAQYKRTLNYNEILNLNLQS